MDDTTQTRWFHLTPGRFVVGLLAVEGLLWLSDRFGWLGWHKGIAVLTGVAAVGVAMVLMLVWFGVALVFGRRFQFSIRSLLVLTVVVAVPCSWVAVNMQEAKRQREAVEDIKATGGSAWYAYQVVDRGDTGDLSLLWTTASQIKGPLPAPTWLQTLLGDETVVGVWGSDIDDGDLGLINKRLSHLKTLVIAINRKITPAGFEHLKGLTHLQKLDVHYTGVTDAGLGHLEGLTQLQELDVSNTKVTDAGLEHLKGLINLRSLNLSDTAVTDMGLKYLNGLTHLQSLDLSNTKVTGVGLEHLKDLSNLRSLGLGLSEVTDVGLKFVAGMTHLDTLNLQFTKITDAGVAKLQTALPNCKIIR